MVLTPPPRLLDFKNWVSYRAVPSKKRPGAIDKVPVNPHTGTNASTTDAATWSAFDQAQAHTAKTGLAGVGFVFTSTPFCGVDFDHCVTDGVIDPAAMARITALDSYSEFSPSGFGVHALAEATLPPGGRKRGDVEMYDSGRFFTFTGNHVPGTPTDVMSRQAEVEALHLAVFGAPPPAQPSGNAHGQTNTGCEGDAEILDLARAASNGMAFARLYDHGDWSGYNSQSEADLALCSHMAYWTGKDAATMDRLFRTSGLMRPKWDVRHGAQTYGETTIQKAIDTCHNTYRSAPPPPPGASTPPPQPPPPPPNPTPTPTPTRRWRSADLVDHLRKAGYTFRINDCDDTLECNGAKMTDTMKAEIRSRLRDDGLQRHILGAEDAYLADASRNRYHPVKEYLGALQYDGGDWIESLAAHFTDRQGVFLLYLRKWLIGAVERVYTGRHHEMLTLDGAQDLGKSWFAKWLCPIPGMFKAAPIRPDSKDDVLATATVWVWEVGELASTTSRADVDALKGFLSNEVVTARHPYGHYPIVKPAIASFIGTFNNSAGVLNDPTGSRRFNICTLEKIEWTYTGLDVNDIWAEAHAAYLAGERGRLTPSEAKQRSEINAEYEVQDPVEDFLRKCFEITHDPNDWQPTVDILTAMAGAGLQGNTKGNSMSLAATMRRLGVAKAQRNNTRGYLGIK